MDSYFILKLLHILSATVITGTGAGIAFFMFMASQSRNLQAIVVTTRHVVLADWLFTAPAILVQFVTGLLLMKQLNYSFTSPWFFTVIALFIFVGLCWLPVVVIQYKLKSIAEQQVVDMELPPNFNRYMRLWIALGIPAFTGVLLIFWLMIFKPMAVH